MVNAEQFRERAVADFRSAKFHVDLKRIRNRRKTDSKIIQVDHNAMNIDVLDKLTGLGLSEDQLAYLYSAQKIDEKALRQYEIEGLLQIMDEEMAKRVKNMYPSPIKDTFGWG